MLETNATSPHKHLRKSLTLVENDGSWHGRFLAESARISHALTDHILAVEHVGSTAVPGLMGKPVLDIAIAVHDERNADACVVPLQALGYEFRGTHGDDPRRRYYVQNNAKQRTAQIHLYIMPAHAWDELLAFRDALRRDEQLATAYASEKYRVADAVQWDKGRYADAKGPFVQSILQQLRDTGWLMVRK